MAGIINKRGKWYARVRKWNGYKQVDTLIPLKTESKTTAWVRLTKVNKVEDDIKAGMKFSFPWQNGDGAVKVIQLSLSQAFEEFLNTKINDGLEYNTIERYKCAGLTLFKVTGKIIPVRSITLNHIDRYKEYWHLKHDPTTININLSKITTFFRWCVDRGYLTEAPRIVKVQDVPKPISYLTDDEFNAIMRLNIIDDHFKRVFLFYRETGCRLSEPFNAELTGHWLIIQPDISKTHRKREIELSPLMLGIYNEIMDRMNTPRLSNPKNGKVELQILKPKSIMDRYSKVFKKSCRELGFGGHKFHNLRDTFAVRLWAVTGDIYYVSKVIGHTSVTTTEKYANFNLRRLLSDFPSLSEQIERILNQAKYAIRDTDFRDTLKLIGVSIDDKTE